MLRLKAELNRAIFSKGFWASTALAVIVMCIGAFEDIQKAFTTPGGLAYGAHTAAMLTALSGSTMLMALPVIAALPCAAGFVEDWRSGYLRHCLPRAGRTGYIVAKTGAAAIAGALAIFAGIAAAFVLFLLVFLPVEKPAPPDFVSLLPVLLGRALVTSLCAALWSLAGLAFSAATLSVHMAYASPFILYYVLVILHARYFPGLPVLSPQEWLNPVRAWPGGGWGVALLVAELAAVAALSFSAAAHRRLAHE